MRRLEIDKWLVCLVHSMYKDVKSRLMGGDGFSEKLDVVVGVHQGSTLSLLLLIILIEAPSRVFHIGCSRELLYTDYLIISAVSIEELLVKMVTWKSDMEKKDIMLKKGRITIMALILIC